MSTAQQTLEGEASITIGNTEDMDQYLTFIMADEEYGVDILRVQEIKGWDKVTPIPNTPHYVRGVINLRGTIVPIIDLRRRFGLKTIPYGATTVVIMLRVMEEDGERTMGIVVDAVSEVYNVSPEQMKPAPDFGSVVQTDFVKGLATVEEKMIIILDIDNLLNSTEMAALDQVVHDEEMEEASAEVEQQENTETETKAVDNQEAQEEESIEDEE